ncbi:GNAT family N-acetyltransferase [Echinimonas agarilytica]|uniref:GNAT family N-acetyltransferase n=1 Tax=Echinimonas agarilytica TaxID=1215918 RepID=A0AA41W7U3_9GAMM|nr:GNAT family N-acetyltransferase [Echinimonas agarilytica]MCM2680525.1 GNAT family N-acetyltransferase [Echinimonas agarilytica]
MTEPVTIFYLEMLSADQVCGKESSSSQAVLTECADKNFAINRFFYQYVGESWQWHDKLSWRESQWRDYAHRDELKLFMLTWHGTPAGYFELEKHTDGSVEIVYFGLANAYTDKGLGGFLLTQALQQAWAWQATRVWVHTCSLDHPYALKNYQSRGMTLYKTEVE